MITKNNFTDQLHGKAKFRREIQVIRVGKFNDDLVEKVEKKVSKAHENNQPVIPFVIDSSGGNVHSLASIYETVESSEIPVLTYLKGKALSCGFVLLGLGDIGYRFSSSHGTGMIHEISWGKRDKISEVEEQIEYGRKLNDYMFKELAEHCGVREQYFLDMMYEDQRNADKWMKSEELKDHNIVDEIGSPKLERSVEIEWDFKTSDKR